MPPAAHKSRANLTFTQNCATERHATMLDMCSWTSNNHRKRMVGIWTNLQFDGSVFDSVSTCSPNPNQACLQVGYSHDRLVTHRLVIGANQPTCICAIAGWLFKLTGWLFTGWLFAGWLFTGWLLTTGWLYGPKVRYNQPAKYCRLVITA